MIDAETTKFAIGGGFVLVTAILVVRSSGVRHADVLPAEQAHASEVAAAPINIEGETDGRLRILTGEPAIPENRKSAPRRAFRLVAGITTLALAGAVGLIVLVRALIEMFQRIGG
jgi:hypothetical protein